MDEESKKKAKERDRRWRERHPDRVKEVRQKYRINHPDKVKESNHNWYINHREKGREYYRRKMEKYPLYGTWSSMLRRTGTRPGAGALEVKNYIDRRIKVCEAWKVYANFEAWAFANGWKRGLQIDRIDNDGNYEPNNCRFVSAAKNQRNRRCTVFVVFNGERMSLADAYEAAHCRLGYELVRNRVCRNKWPLERALTEPAKEEK